MTFKHVKFEDSPTMRALEKVAKEKGLVKPEPLQKKASVTKRADYTPSNDFMENILKLCAGLRANGLEKAASEVETNYLKFKQAQTLYETSKEKGEDLVQSAHPKGSHKLEGVEGEEATVEDILDQHNKLVEIVNKKPTGKLSTAQIINEVKVALGQEAQAPAETQEEIIAKMEAILSTMPGSAGALTQMIIRYGSSYDWADPIDQEKATQLGAALSQTLGARPWDRSKQNAASKAFKDLYMWAWDTASYESSVWHSSEHNKQSKELWNQRIQPQVNVFGTKLAQLDQWLTKLETIEFLRTQNLYKAPQGSGEGSGTVTIPQVDIVADPILGEGAALVNRLKQYSGMKQVSRNQGAANWVKDEIGEIQDVMQRFNQSNQSLGENEKMDEGVRASFKNELNQKKLEIDDFYRQMTASK